MGCDRGVDGVCIWVLILSLGWLLIQVHLLRLGRGWRQAQRAWLPRDFHARQQTLKVIFRHWCFWIQDLWQRSRIPVISRPPPLSLPPLPPRHAPLPPDIRCRRSIRPPRSGALPPPPLPRDRAILCLVQSRCIRRRRWPACRQRRRCCRQEGSHVLLAGPCWPSCRDAH